MAVVLLAQLPSIASAKGASGREDARSPAHAAQRDATPRARSMSGPR